MINIIIYILISLFVCPKAMAKTLWHCHKTGHNYDMVIFNFRYNIHCHHCDKVFLIEHDNDDECFPLDD